MDQSDWYQTLFMQSPCPMWVLDQQSMDFIEVNESAIQQYGYNRDEFLKMKLPDVRFDGEVHAGVNLKTVMRSQTSSAFYDLGNSCHVRKNGEAFYVHVYSQHILFKGKNALLAYLLNDTERLLAEAEKHTLFDQVLAEGQKLEKHQKQLAEIAWIQSHKVRSPLATLMGLINLLQENYPVDEDKKTILEGIKTASAKLDKVIKEIVDKTVHKK